MKIKLDENLPSGLAISLGRLGHDVHTANQEGLTGHPDTELWRAAQKESRFLITQDLDFADLRRFAPGSHHGILMIRLRSPSRRSLSMRVTEIFQIEDVGDWAGCFVVATERKIRLLKPPNKQNS
jgi:predicted nuclease of predicted toxin-antitoxin system